MNGKKKYIVIFGSVFLVLLLTIIGMLCWFASPGVHVLFNCVHIDISEKVYIVNEDLEIIGEELLTIEGTATPQGSGTQAKEGSFTLFEVGGFLTVTSDDVCWVKTYECKSNVLMLVIDKGTLVEDSDGEIVSGNSQYVYIFIDKDTSEILMCTVKIPSESGHDTYYFITTDDVSVISKINQRASFE